MKNPHQPDPIYLIKERMVNNMFLIMTIIAIPLMISVLFRTRITGWNYAIISQIGIISIVIGMLPFLKRFSKNFKAHFIIVTILVIALTGIHKLGFFAAGKVYVIPITIIAALMINRKAAYVYLVIYLLFYLGFSWLYVHGRLHLGFNANIFVKEYSTWITFGLVALLVSLGLMTIVDQYDLAHRRLLTSSKINEENYRLLFEEAAEGILLSNRHGEILQTNKCLGELSGYKTEELENGNLQDFFRAGEPVSDLIDYKKILTGLADTGSHKLLARDREIDVELRSIQLSDGRIQTFVNDISKRAEAERKIRESEKRYRTLFDNASDAIFQLKDFKFYDCNTRALELFGCKREFIIGSDPGFFSPEFQPNGRRSEEVSLELLHQTLAGIPQFFEWKHCKFNRETFDAEVSLATIELNGVKYIQGLVRDITERKELNRKLYIASLTAEENERERLAREIHDGLGPLLSTSKIYLHNLLDSEDRKEAENFQGKIEHTLDEALTSIREISNNISPHILRNFGLLHAIRSYAQKLESILPIRIENGLSESERYPEAMEATIYRIISELINNTLKHAQASQIDIHLEEVNRRILVTYLDNGKGFNYEKLKHSGKGHGLLNIQSRIDSMNGQYSFESSPGEGVRVIFELPV
ncbi:MAG: PAS domain S-box protein [Bacteroidales bacterium]|nr:PAS domain S-box protein [Bacteroidales bacterium]